jgi:hypothetical protein
MPVKAFAELTDRLTRQIDKSDGPIEILPLLQRYQQVCLSTLE